MKNLITLKKALFIAMLTLSIVSCDKENKEEPTLLLVKETMESDLYGFETLDYEYNNENKLVKMHIHSETEDYADDLELSLTYDNDLLTELLMLAEGMEQKVAFSYNEDSIFSLSSYKLEDEAWSDGDMKNVWVLDGQQQVIRAEEYFGYFDQWILHSYNNYEWTNGNCVEDVHVYNLGNKKKSAKLISRFMLGMNQGSALKLGSNETTLITALEYSSLKNPYQSLGLLYAADIKNYNVLSTKKVSTSDGEDYVYTYTYDFNDKNYPTKMVETDSEGNTMTTIYDYKTIN